MSKPGMEEEKLAAPLGLRNILLRTDLTDEAYPQAQEAAALAKDHGARLILLHSYQLKPAEEAAEALPPTEQMAQARLDVLALDLHTRYGISVTRMLKPQLETDDTAAIARLLRADLVLTQPGREPASPLN